MSLTSTKITVGTAAVQVVAGSINPQYVTLHNMEKSSNEFIHIGPDATITTNNSTHLDPSETLKMTLLPGEELYAIAGKNLPLGVIVQKQGI
jgi:hypothetical protein